MKKEIENICDATVDNYKYAVQNLRYDGDYINHFAALLNGYHKRNIKHDLIRKIRTYIKDNTSKMSVFRGDMLYILSFLIAGNEDDYLSMCDAIIETFEMFIDENFKENEYLLLSAYAIVKYSKEDTRLEKIKNTRYIFNIIKNKYGELTKEDDYLLCTLLALNDIKFDSVTEYMEHIFNYIHDLKLFSNNYVQCLTNSILLNKNQHVPEKVISFLTGLKSNNLKVGYQFLQVMGVLVKDQNVDKSINSMKEIIEYLCDKESEYDFYIDKDFRNMIALVIALVDIEEDKTKYVDELLAFGVYSFLTSKNAGILNQVLA